MSSAEFTGGERVLTGQRQHGDVAGDDLSDREEHELGDGGAGRGMAKRSGGSTAIRWQRR